MPRPLGPRGVLPILDGLVSGVVLVVEPDRGRLLDLGEELVVVLRLAQAVEEQLDALLLVERGEAPLGIVYATDATASPGLRVVGTFPSGSHTPVTYPFALTQRAAGNGAARALLNFLRGPQAGETWRRFGFTVL